MVDEDPTPHAYRAQLRQWLAENSELLRDYAQRPAGDIRSAIDHERGLLQLLYSAGWSRYGWPRHVGGFGGSVLLRAVLYDELAAHDVETPEAYVILETLGPILVEFAAGLASRHLRSFLSGDEIWAQGFSEPDAGSDLASLRTRAQAAPGGYRLNGQKVWTTLGQFANHAAVLARTGPADSAHRGLTMLWVDLSASGVTVRPILAISGRDEFAEMFFEDVYVPSSETIGGEGDGWAVAMFLLQYERGMYAWLRQAILRRRLRQLAARLHGCPTGSRPGGEAALGAALGLVAILRSLSLHTVGRLGSGENPGGEISIDKVTLGLAEQATFDAVRRLDPDGFATGGSVADDVLREEWFYSRASTIFGGAIDIQRDIVADRVLHLPRASR